MPPWMPSLWIVIPAAAAALAAVLLVCKALSTNPDRTGQRIALWLLALVFTFFGPFSAVPFAWPPTAWAAGINADKDFKDLWLAMIAMLLFSLSSIVDNLIRSYRDISKFSRFLTPIVTALYITALTIGMYKYASFEGVKLPDGTFYSYWTLVWVGTALGVVWEFLIALEIRD